MQESFSPKQELLTHIRLWWVPFIFACTGAFIGFLFSYIMPAKYEAQAEINLAVDFSKIGIVTDIEQDQIIEMVGDICKSDIVISRLIERVPEFTEDDFSQMYALERRNMKWVLKMRHTDAEFVSEVVHNWQAISYEEIQFAYEHAILVDSYTDYLNTLSGCFEQSVAQPSGATACSFLTMPELQDEITKIAVKIKEEQKLSQGISPAISVSVTNQEKQPAQQVSGIKVWLILAGGFIGFLVGIWGIPAINKRSVKL
jgi:hypothetical protein